MPAWWPLNDGKRTYDLSHLHPFHLDVDIDGEEIEVAVDFGSHVFSDEKARGFAIPGTGRFFCPDRYGTSFSVAHFMGTGFVDAHIRAYLNIKKQQQFYTTDAGDVAIFMTIQKPAGSANSLKCHVVSAYDPTWGRHQLPQAGNLYKVRTVLKRKIHGDPIPTFKGRK